MLNMLEGHVYYCCNTGNVQYIVEDEVGFLLLMLLVFIFCWVHVYYYLFAVSLLHFVKVLSRTLEGTQKNRE